MNVCKFLNIIILILLLSTPVFSSDIKYGYNDMGEYGPIAIDGNNIKYGYNVYGDYVPISINSQKFDNNNKDSNKIYEIEYNFNSKGKYVPTSIGGERLKFEFKNY